MTTDKYRILFAPDGIHYQHAKSGGCARMWDYFATNTDIRIQLAVNPYAKFRLVQGDRILAELPTKEVTKCSPSKS